MRSLKNSAETTYVYTYRNLRLCFLCFLSSWEKNLPRQFRVSSHIPTWRHFPNPDPSFVCLISYCFMFILLFPDY
jgi:hypothetical protein